MSIELEVQKLEHDALVSLYVLDTTPIGGSDIFRFTSMPDIAGDVVFGGVTYAAVDIDVNGFSWDGRGQFPKPKIRVANISGLVTGAIIALGDLVGSRFYRLRTFARHLDYGTDPDATAMFPPEIYTVDQLSKMNKVYVEWQLASIVDQMGVELPRRQCLRDSCTHQYRILNTFTGQFDYTNATCPYSDAVYYTEDDVVTADITKDKCSKKLSGCRLRFGQNGVLPTRSFPGIARSLG